MSEKYKATSSKDPDRNYTTEVILEKDNSGEATKSIRVGGEPVELTEAQRATAAKYLNVRKATDEEVKAAEDDPSVSEETADKLAAEDQVSTTPAVSPPNSPAAEEARVSRRGGGDK